MKKDIGYFPHDTNARNDERILELRAEHGPAGYAYWFMLCELMAEQEDGYLFVDRMAGYALAIGTDKKTITAFVNEALELGLLVQYDQNIITSRRMQDHKDTRRAMKEGARSRWKRKADQAPVTTEAPPEKPTAAEWDTTPAEYMKTEGSLELDVMRMQLSKDLASAGTTIEAALEKWSTTMIANDTTISRREPGRRKQMVASFRRYVENWATNAKNHGNKQEIKREVKA